MNALPCPLLIVTDRHQARWPLQHIVCDALAAGARWFWLRDRDLPPAERRALAIELAEVVRQAGGCLSIGADVGLAAEAGTGAVHVRSIADIAPARQALGAAALIGLSAHSVTDATEAQRAGADYVTLSPIYETASKPDYGPALGIGTIEHAAQFGIPVVALGGIDAANAATVRAAGASAIAVMGGIMRTDDTHRTIKALLASAR